MKNDRQGLDRPLLVVSEPPDPNPRRSSAAQNVWRRIVSRTQDPALNRFLTEADFESFAFEGTDAGTKRIRDRIAEGDIKAVLTLGEAAFGSATGHTGHLKLRGYAIDVNGIPCVGTYAPSYIMGGKFHLARVVQSDMLKALGIARNGAESLHRTKEYITRPDPSAAMAWFDGWQRAGTPPIAFDIETPWSDHKDEAMTYEEDSSYTILMCSFAYEPYKAISLPWTPPYIDIAKAILSNAPQTLVWNAKFDVPRLMANDCDFGGEIIDAMIAWHWLEPSLPMGLKFVAPFLCPDMDAWALQRKDDFALYNCGDADVLLRAFQAISDRLKLQGRWPTFERHFLKFGKILTKMTARGINVDLGMRRESRALFEQEYLQVVGEAVSMAPIEVRPSHPKKGYKKDEAALRKSGLWQESAMRSIAVEISDEEAEKAAAKQARKEEKEMARASKLLAKSKPKRASKGKKQKELNYEPM
jgi:hypothetical protein